MSRYARGAAIMGSNPLFWEFLTQTTGRRVCDSFTAAAEVRLACSVMSRRALDTNLEASRAYLALVERFNEWLGARHAAP